MVIVGLSNTYISTYFHVSPFIIAIICLVGVGVCQGPPCAKQQLAFIYIRRRKKASIVRSRGRALGIEATPSILCISHMYLILHYDSLQKNKEYNDNESLFFVATYSILNLS